MKMLLQIVVLVALIIMPITSISAEHETKATNKMHKVVFEVAIDGIEKWESALRNVANVQKALGSTKMEVVAHGKGVGMLLVKTGSANPEMKATVEKLHGQGVVFAVCENTMKRMQITKDQLMPLATTVDSGVTEVIRKQEAGFSYIKSGG